MSLLISIPVGIFNYSAFTISQYILVSRMLGERIHPRPFVINLVLQNIIMLLIEMVPAYGLGIYLADYPGDYNIAVNIIMNMFAVILIVIFRVYYRTALPKTIAAAALSHFVTYTIAVTGLETFIYSRVSVMDNLFTLIVFGNILPNLGVIPIALLASFLLKKANFSQYFSNLFSSWKKSVITVTVSLLLMNSFGVFVTLYPDAQFNLEYWWLPFLFLVIASMLCIQFGAVYIAGQDKIRAQEETIAQQQAHLLMLEELQQEYRTFRHDLNNLLSGAALHAQEGNLTAVRDFMKNTGSYFDIKLGKQIQQLEGLSRVEIFPLRSLLTAKLTAMRQKNIAVKLEILEPIENTIMRQEDLIRCVGILLDNALEGAPKSDGVVCIMLLQQPSELFVVIANNYDAKPDLSQIRQEGFSVKGKGRGTGLSGYRAILSGYSGCVTRVYLKDGFFAQELHIPSNGRGDAV